MNRIIATFVSDYDSGKSDGSGRVLCPFCGEVAHERDIEEYSERGSGRSLELCTNCREGFERDIGMTLDTDELEEPIFSQIWNAIPAQEEEESGLNEETAQQVAKALGGDAWQSGGGIWLVLFRRTGGGFVALSEDVVCEYASESAFEHGEQPVVSTLLH